MYERGINMKKLAALVCLLLILSVNISAYGSDIQVPQSSLYPYQSTIVFQEEFIGGNAANGGIGALGFGMNGGTAVGLSGSTNRFGIIQRATGAVANTLSALYYSGFTTNLFSPAVSHSLLEIVRLNTNDANTEVRIGSMASINTNPPADGIFFEKLAADTNWFCVTRAGGVQTRTDSGIAVTTSFDKFFYGRDSSGVTFILNATSVCNHTTNIPTTFVVPGLHINNTAAVSKTIDIDYLEIRIAVTR